MGKWKNNKANGHGIYVTEKSHYQGKNAFIQGISINLSSKVTAFNPLQMEISIEATTKAENHTERDSTLGRMELTTKDISTKD